MTVREPAERSLRFHEENVQYNDRTNKKLKCFLLHLRHLLSTADHGERKSWPPYKNSVYISLNNSIADWDVFCLLSSVYKNIPQRAPSWRTALSAVYYGYTGTLHMQSAPYIIICFYTDERSGTSRAVIALLRRSKTALFSPKQSGFVYLYRQTSTIYAIMNLRNACRSAGRCCNGGQPSLSSPVRGRKEVAQCRRRLFGSLYVQLLFCTFSSYMRDDRPEATERSST